jgi:choline dehydrogenase-like flavoprotein
MFVDARSLESDSRLQYDLCIIGGGAAGITIAHELRTAPFRTCLLESGSLEAQAETQALYTAGSVTNPWFPRPDTSRLRFFGGTTNHWSGSCEPLNEIDFERRDWVPHSGWPITLADLGPYYIQADGYCQLVDTVFDSRTWSQRSGHRTLPLDGKLFRTAIAYGSPPTRFGQVYRPALKDAHSVDVYLNANVTEIVAAANGLSIVAVRAAVLEGPRFTVDAKAFVLATGGIENARLLLVSDGVQTAGLGNDKGLVGRFFMDHPVLNGAILRPTAPEQFRDYLGPSAPAPMVGANLELTQQAQLEQRLNNMRLPFVEVTRYRASEGIGSYHELERAMGDEELKGSLWGHIGNVAADFDMVLEAAARRLFGIHLFDSAEDRGFYLFASMLEQTPDPENRVTLSAERDALGLRRVDLRWRVSEADKANAWKVLELLGREFARTGLGRLRLLRDDARVWEDQLGFGDHHIGTTRMSDDPQTGVVDRNQKVHGLFNLFVGGSSVFPTGGHVPPTLTIVAMSIRLADHLRSWMKS